MPWGGRGKVIKAAQVADASSTVVWGQASTPETPPAQIEVIRDAGEIVGVMVRCQCGEVHEFELVGQEESSSGKEK